MRRAARGFSLVEIIVAMTILVVTLAGFAGLTAQYMRRARSLNLQVAMAALFAEQSQRLIVLPFDSLPSRAGCQTFTTGTLAHTRCITVTATTNSRYTVTLVITPATTAVRPDSLSFARVKPASNALCTGC